MKKEVFEIPKSENAGIYMIYNMNKHKAYIGQTLNFHSRAEQHNNNLLYNYHSNKEMQNDFNNGDRFFFVILENMGVACKREDMLLREKQYIYAFNEVFYKKTYNQESDEQLEKNLFFDMVYPTIKGIRKDLRKKLNCHLFTLERCKVDTLTEKFRAINETMERDKEGECNGKYIDRAGH